MAKLTYEKAFGVTLIALSFTACKKDDEKTTSGGLLDKLVILDGGDSTVGRFTYDANNRISEYLYISNSGGTIDTFRLNLTRDAAGRITQATQKENSRTPALYTITYNGNTSQLKSVVIAYTADKDSMAYTYNGNLIQEDHYYKSGTNPFSLNARLNYTVQNGNIVSVKQVNINNGALESEVTNTYDSNKPAQYRTPEEALITLFYEMGLANNIIKSQTVNSLNPSLNDLITVSYTYGSTGQPLSGALTGTNSGTGTIKFYYK